MKKYLLLILFFIFVQATYAGIKITNKIDYYSFTGSTVQEMRRSLNKNGIRHGAAVYHGYANYYVRWRYDSEMKNGKCYLTDIDVQVKNVLTLPRWKKPWFFRPSKKVINKWDGYIKALTLHEHGHKDIAIVGTRKMYNALKNLRPNQSCQALLIQANKIARSHLAEIDKKQVEYDTVTDHGRTQGAYFR